MRIFKLKSTTYPVSKEVCGDCRHAKLITENSTGAIHESAHYYECAAGCEAKCAAEDEKKREEEMEC